MKWLKVLLKLTMNFLLVVACLLAITAVFTKVSGGEPTLLNHQMKAVLSGSMEPTFQTGSIITIELAKNPSTYQKGDIITFRMDDKVITHRIVETETKNGQVSYKTKGDHNDGLDFWTVPADKVIGEYTGFTLPYVGYALNLVQSKLGTALLLFIPGLIIFISAIRTIFLAARRIEAQKA